MRGPLAKLNRLAVVVGFVGCLGLPGCTYSGGELLYTLGLGRGAKIKAEFRLTRAPLLIFIDDTHERVDWPPARTSLFDELSQELLRHKAATKIIPLETIDSLRKSHANFTELSCRQVGEMAEADQVLWIETGDFLAEEQFTEVNIAAYWDVSAKVINPNEKESRSRVRLWPSQREGRPMIATLSGADVQRLKTKDAIAKELARKLAVDIAKLFYDYRAGDFD